MSGPPEQEEPDEPEDPFEYHSLFPGTNWETVGKMRAEGSLLWEQLRNIDPLEDFALALSALDLIELRKIVFAIRLEASRKRP